MEALQRAAREADISAVASLAHALRGSVGNFGDASALALCEELERCATVQSGTRKIDLTVARLRTAIEELRATLEDERALTRPI